MHYFKFDIATWIQSTRHLTPEEEGVYLRLVNHYYDTEKPLPVEIQPFLKRLQLRGHLDLVNEILTDFFILTEKGWSHNKCNELLKEYHKGAKKNKLNGQKGGRPSKTKASSVTQTEPSGLITETQTEPKHNPNYELVTTNNELGISKDKLKTKVKKFTPPTEQEIHEYIVQKGHWEDKGAEARKFLDNYQAQGWKLSNGNKMVDWKATANKWLRNKQQWDNK